ncbi:MAG: S9 family peptidase [Vulcanimicrobiaceae bacterium]
MRPLRRALWCCAMLLASFASASAAASAAPFTIDDTYAIAGLSAPRISPDGRSLLFVRSRVDVQNDRRIGELVLLNVATKRARQLTYGRLGVADPIWSPHGRRIAFLAQAAGKTEQIFVMPMDGGDARQVTRAPQGVQEYAWRPDGGAIAYLTTDSLPKKTGAARFQDSYRVTDNAYLTPGPFPPSHLWLAIPGRPAQRLTGGSWSVAAGDAESTISWSPHGKTIAYVRLPDALLGDANRSVVELLDVAGKRSRSLTGGTRYEFNPRISPAGTRVAYTYPRGGVPMNDADIFVSNGGGPGVDVTRGIDRNTGDYAWFPNGRSLLVAGDDGTQRALWRVRLDGRFRKLDLGDVSAFGNFDGSIARNGAIAFVGVTPHHPAEIYYLASPHGKPQRMTDYNAATAGLNLGRVRPVAWTFAGYHEDGVLTYPVGFPHARGGASAKRYPLVLLIHGGPTGASTASFDQLAQIMAAHGWFVFEPNYRGSDNLGNAYQHAIYIDATRGPGEDIRAGLAAVERLAPIDPTRVCASGWSYGGMLTSWLITQYHDWRCAVSGAAVNDLVYDYSLADDISADRESMPGSPFVGKNMALYRKVSPFTYYRNVRTPTLILADTYDVRVPAAQSYVFYHALHDRGVPVAFYEWPVHGHFPSDPVRIADVYRHWIAWLERYL